MFGANVSAQETEKPEDTLSFRLIRQDDIIKVRNPKSAYKKLKYLKLGSAGSISFGGSQRFQLEGFVNEEFDRDLDQTDNWILSRTMLHAHLKLKNRFELFGELNTSLITSKANVVPVDRDQLSLNQLFVQFNASENWKLFAGRNNLRLGSGRLVDIREGPNVRISFDMAGFEWKNSKNKLKVFYAIPVRPQEGIFDNDVFDLNEQLAVSYFTHNWENGNGIDFYGMYKLENNKQWDAGIDDDERVSIGTRLFGKLKGIDYNSEFVYQFGRFGVTPISAWTASFDLSKKIKKNWIVGVRTEAISGNNDSQSETFNTFDALYPRGAYFGRVARFGPSNLIDLHPYLERSFKQFNVSLDYVAFWRFSLTDGLYNPALILGYPSINSERFIGNQIGAIISYQLNNFISLEVESNVIFPGQFLTNSALDDNLVHYVVTAEFKF